MEKDEITSNMYTYTYILKAETEENFREFREGRRIKEIESGGNFMNY